MPFQTQAFAAHKVAEALKSYAVQRRNVGALDIHIDIKFCGVCHSDLHQAKDEWGGGIFPMVPGHEIVGIVKSVGEKVTKLKPGDAAAVGCFVDSCRTCEDCMMNEEQHCARAALTYNGLDLEGKPTYGGYSKDIVVAERFVCRVPDSFKNDLASVAPLLCAGITTWSPMIRHGMNQPGKKIGVVGLGGLGHMAVKFGVAFGNEVTVISRTQGKKEEALKVLGAQRFVVSTDEKQMQSAKASLDFIIDCVSAPKDMNSYIALLKNKGVLVSVALPPQGFNFGLNPFALITNSKGVFGSVVGGLKATQEMLDYCGRKQLKPMIEVIKIDYINQAYERMLKSDVRYRFVIDVANSAF